MKKSEIPLVGTKGIFKVWVRGSSETDCEERGEHLGVRVIFVACWEVEDDWFRCLSESVWTSKECLRDWERVFELREKRVFEWGIWNCSVYCAYFESYKLDFYVAKFRPPGKFVHVSVLTNRAKRVLKARVLIGSRVLETRDASFPLSFKTGQLTKLLAL